MPVSTQQPPARVTGTIGVALIDGTPLVREGLSSLVNRTAGLRFLGSAEAANVGLRLCQRLRPDVVLVDAALDPRGQLAHLVSSAGATRVVLLIDDARRTNQYLAGALAAGVAGVIRRSAQPAELLRAIQAVHTEGRYLDPALAPVLAAPAPRAQPQPRQALSKREHQVLQLIADGLENQAIADVLYVSVETVRTHVKSILRKLSSRDRTHAVAVAFRSGVLVVDESVPGSRPAQD